MLRCMFFLSHINKFVCDVAKPEEELTVEMKAAKLCVQSSSTCARLFVCNGNNNNNKVYLHTDAVIDCRVCVCFAGMI